MGKNAVRQYVCRWDAQNTRISVPIVMNRPPRMTLAVAASFKTKKANAILITTLNLSTGMTLEASPICSALK